MSSMLELCYMGILVQIDEKELSDKFRFQVFNIRVFGVEKMTFVVISVIFHALRATRPDTVSANTGYTARPGSFSKGLRTNLDTTSAFLTQLKDISIYLIDVHSLESEVGNVKI